MQPQDQNLQANDPLYKQDNGDSSVQPEQSLDPPVTEPETGSDQPEISYVQPPVEGFSTSEPQAQLSEQPLEAPETPPSELASNDEEGQVAQPVAVEPTETSEEMSDIQSPAVPEVVTDTVQTINHQEDTQELPETPGQPGGITQEPNGYGQSEPQPSAPETTETPEAPDLTDVAEEPTQVPEQTIEALAAVGSTTSVESQAGTPESTAPSAERVSLTDHASFTPQEPQAVAGEAAPAEKENIYTEICTEIIKEQEQIIGTLAVEQAGYVEGLTVDPVTYHCTVSGDGSKVIDDLIEQYRDFFGHAAVEVCKEAASRFLAKLPAEEMPASLK